MIMPFGKFKGVAVKDLELDYCRWLLENVKFKSKDLREEIEVRVLTLEQQLDDLAENYQGHDEDMR